MALEVSGLSLQFGGVRALQGVSFEVPDGELSGVIGPNGAGKTTLFNVISGHYAPDSGSVTLDGRRTSGQPSWKVARLGVARTFQNPRVFPSLTVTENILAGTEPERGASWFRASRSGRARAAEWIEMVGLQDVATMPGGALSYGHARRLEIARACARGPRVLLLDEPAAGMNAAECGALMELVQRINRERGITVLLIEHNMRVVFGLCSTVHVLNFGEVIASGPADTVRDDPAVIEAYLGAEALADEVAE
jgi:branched-chain amino acid transport system ATP-binding protein